MSEIVTIVIGIPEQVSVTVAQTVEPVSVYVSDGSGGAAGRNLSKMFYTATGNEGGSITVPGIGASVWNQVTQGVTPLKQVSVVPGSLQYALNGDNVIFGDHPLAGENILIEWQ